MCFLDMERLIATEQMDGEVACLRCRGGAKLSQSLDKPPTVKRYISLELRYLYFLHFTSLVFNYIVLVWHSSLGLGRTSLGLHSQLVLTYSFPTRWPSKTECICHLKWFGPQRSWPQTQPRPPSACFRGKSNFSEQQIRGTCLDRWARIRCLTLYTSKLSQLIEFNQNIPTISVY